MGSGSTMIAALLNNRKAIGLEIDKEYYSLAKKRIIEETKILDKKLLPSLLIR